GRATGSWLFLPIGKAIGLYARHCRRLVLQRQRAIRQRVATAGDAGAGEGDELNPLALSRLKAHRRPGGDVEPHAVSFAPVEAERAVGLEKMVVTAHLNWPIAGIGDGDLDGLAAVVEGDFPRRRPHLSGNERLRRALERRGRWHGQKAAVKGER